MGLRATGNMKESGGGHPCAQPHGEGQRGGSGSYLGKQGKLDPRHTMLTNVAFHTYGDGIPCILCAHYTIVTYFLGGF